MVTSGRKYISIAEVEALLKDAPPEVKSRFEKKKGELPVRLPKPPPPAGSIGIRAAGRKYGITHTTISRWVKSGIIMVVLETKNDKYINEKQLQYHLEKRKN